jgi:hypothetical protein
MTVEIKVLINILYFIGASLLLLITFSLFYQRVPEGTFAQLLTNYFACENNGVSHNCDSSRAELNKTVSITIPFDIAFLIFTLLPVVNLTFIVNVQQLKKYKCCVKKIRYTSSTKSTSPGTELLEVKKNPSAV